MKIHEASQIRALDPATAADKPRDARQVRERSPDRVSTAETAKVARAVAAASQGAGAARAARLQAIEAAVRNGTYKPDPQRIAQEILDDAELSAKLQAVLHQ
jgi:negative regulator of flagellin synthesis FlgM